MQKNLPTLVLGEIVNEPLPLSLDTLIIKINSLKLYTNNKYIYSYISLIYLGELEQLLLAIKLFNGSNSTSSSFIKWRPKINNINRCLLVILYHTHIAYN